MHTLKGAAGVVGYKGASKLAHRMEDLLDRLYEGTAALTPARSQRSASSSDALHDLIVGTAGRRSRCAPLGHPPVREVRRAWSAHRRLSPMSRRRDGRVAAGATSARSRQKPARLPPATPSAAPAEPARAGSRSPRRRRAPPEVDDRRGGGQVLRVPLAAPQRARARRLASWSSTARRSSSTTRRSSSRSTS